MKPSAPFSRALEVDASQVYSGLRSRRFHKIKGHKGLAKHAKICFVCPGFFIIAL